MTRKQEEKINQIMMGVLAAAGLVFVNVIVYLMG